VFQVMGARGLFFSAAGHINRRYRSPDVALAALSGWAIVLGAVRHLRQLLNYSTCRRLARLRRRGRHAVLLSAAARADEAVVFPA
jgi:hypothetical protein